MNLFASINPLSNEISNSGANNPSALPFTPIATRTQLLSMSSPDSSLILTFFDVIISSTLALVLISIPRLRNIFLSSLDTSESSNGKILSTASIKVTLAPNELKNEQIQRQLHRLL